MSGRVRIHVVHDLAAGQRVPLSREQAHYLFGVMRHTVGDTLSLFNGKDGEWLCEVAEAGKRAGVLTCLSQSAPHRMPPDLWLLFAPIKKARTDFIVEKAVEMGVRRICPVLTEFTNSERVRQDRLQAHATEAAEQCGATYVPEVAEAVRLNQLLPNWDITRRILYCDEAMAGHEPAALQGEDPWAILIGPEGGFSERERAQLRDMECTQATALGPRILRSDTAAVAALTLWQTSCGDWR